MSAASMRAALRDWAEERDKEDKGCGSFAAFAKLIADANDDAILERLEEIMDFHRAEEALG